jgi:hypothetical protein
MSGHNKHDLGMSKKEKRIRLAVVIAMLTCLVLLVIIFIVLMVVLIPHKSQVALETGVGTTSFNIAYCPSEQDTSCCLSGDDCHFRWRNVSSFSFVQDYAISVTNNNFLPMKIGKVVVSVKHGGTQIAVGQLNAGKVAKRKETVLHVPVSWDSTEIIESQMKAVMCELAGSGSQDGQNVNKNLGLTVEVQMSEAKYLATRLKFDFDNVARSVSLKDQCYNLPNQCDIPSLMRNIVCV